MAGAFFPVVYTIRQTDQSTELDTTRRESILSGMPRSVMTHPNADKTQLAGTISLLGSATPQTIGHKRARLSRSERPTGRSPRRKTKRDGQKELRRQALELRKGGASYWAIAHTLGYKNAEAAHKAVSRAVEGLEVESQIELFAIQQERLNTMLLTIWPQVQAGDTRAIQTALSIWGEINSMNGITPEINVNLHHSGLPDTVQNVLVVGGNKDEYMKALSRMAGIQDPVPLPVGGEIINAEHTTQVRRRRKLPIHKHGWVPHARTGIDVDIAQVISPHDDIEDAGEYVKNMRRKNT